MTNLSRALSEIPAILVKKFYNRNPRVSAKASSTSDLAD
jgi:hypothetical protein